MKIIFLYSVDLADGPLVCKRSIICGLCKVGSCTACSTL